MTNNVLKNTRAFRIAATGQYDLEIPDCFERSIIRRELDILLDIKQVYPFRNNYAEWFFAMFCYPGDKQSEGLKDSVNRKELEKNICI